MEIKLALIQACNAYVEERIQTAQQALTDNRGSLESEAKSSAGDKFETARELIQQDILRNEILLADTREMKVLLSKIDIHQSYTTIQSGSIVECDSGTFFFAIGIGRLNLQGKEYFVVSINSPIGLAFKDKGAGETVTFNGKVHRIKKVY